MIKVLFVCLGNICRSPMADAVFAHMVKEAGLEDQIMVDSAGTGSWHVGEPAHRGTLNILQKNSIPYNGRARQLTRRDLSDFDYVLTMDHSNYENVMRYVGNEPQSEVRMFLSYANEAGLVDEAAVPDPYYDGRFAEVYELVNKGSRALLDHIRQKHGI
ncbi:MAG: low molecular weight phosphotyrosine protein phosphatase [Anaerolineae bacterium]|nr:low molecular weight phosphotyrosine protein phosphatase [Anaerolineae bacterium]